MIASKHSKSRVLLCPAPALLANSTRTCVSERRGHANAIPLSDSIAAAGFADNSSSAAPLDTRCVRFAGETAWPSPTGDFLEISMHAALISIVLLSGTCGDFPQSESRTAVVQRAPSFAAVNDLPQGPEHLGVSTGRRLSTANSQVAAPRTVAKFDDCPEQFSRPAAAIKIFPRG